MKNLSRFFPLCCWVCGFALVLLFALGFLRVYSWEIPVFHLDGAYQTYSGLSRLSGGEVFGRDFYPYLGVGVTLLLYPIYWVVGGGILGCTSSVYVGLIFLRWLVLSLCVRLFFPKCSGSVSGFVGAVLLGFVMWLRFSGMTVQYLEGISLTYLLDFFRLGNSLRAFRSALPLLMACLVLFSVVRLRGVWQALAFLGMLSVCLLWSNDYGVPVWGMVFLTWVGIVWFQRPVSLWLGVAVVPLSMLGFFLLLALLTRGHPMELLHYNFVDVRGDQYWYFGPWTEGGRIFSIWEIPSKIYGEIGLGGVAGLLLPFLWFLRGRTISTWLIFFVSAGLFGGGFVASYGGHLDEYFRQYLFWVLNLFFFAMASGCVWVLHQVFTRHSKRILASFSPGFLPFLRSLLYVVPFGFFFCFGLMFWNDAEKLWGLSFSENRVVGETDKGVSFFYDKQLKGYLPEKYRAVLDRARALPATDSLLEEYWGLWGLVRGKHASPPVDSLIHALGSVRPVFLAELKKGPDWVVTSSPGASNEWFSWSVAANWWVWGEVFRSYDLEGEYGITFLWHKRKFPQEWLAVPSKLSAELLSADGAASGQPLFEIDAPDAGFYEVTLPLRCELGTSRNLVMLESRISEAIDSGGFLAIDTRLREFVYPIWVSTPGKQWFSFKVLGNCPDKTRVYSEGPVSVRRVQIPAGFWTPDGK